MLTGRRAFAGDDVSDVLASVLMREPDLAALPAAAPPSIRRLLRRCLHKDSQERLRDIGDARIEIRESLSNADADVTLASVPAPDHRSRERLAWIGALAVLVLALAAALIFARRPAPAAPEMRVEITTPPTIVPMSLAISPDGRTIAFVARSEGQSRLWLRSLESGATAALPGTDGAESPFWSPDSQSVGFFADSKLRRVDVDDGSVQTLANARSGLGGTWNRDNVILFASLGSPISRVPATGGEPVALPRLAQQGSDFAPQFLPDGRHFLYYVRGNPEVRGVYVGQLDETLDARRLLNSDTGGRLCPVGAIAVRPPRDALCPELRCRSGSSCPAIPIQLPSACRVVRIPAYRCPARARSRIARARQTLSPNSCGSIGPARKSAGLAISSAHRCQIRRSPQMVSMSCCTEACREIPTSGYST